MDKEKKENLAIEIELKKTLDSDKVAVAKAYDQINSLMELIVAMTLTQEELEYRLANNQINHEPEIKLQEHIDGTKRAMAKIYDEIDGMIKMIVVMKLTQVELERRFRNSQLERRLKAEMAAKD